MSDLQGHVLSLSLYKETNRILEFKKYPTNQTQNRKPVPHIQLLSFRSLLQIPNIG